MTNAFPTKSLLSVLLFLLCWSNHTMATDYYWVNGIGNWNDPAHWSTSSGGSSAGVVPGKADNAIIDANSLVGESSTIYITENFLINDLTVKANKYISFVGESVNATIFGNLDIQSYTAFYLSEGIHFKNENNSINEINSGSYTFYSDLYFDEGKWSISNHIDTWEDNTIQFKKGSFKSNGYTVHANSIIANHASYNFDFTDSHISATEELDLSKAKNIGGEATYHVLPAVSVTDDFTKFTDDGDVIAGIIENCVGSALVLELVATSDYNGANISCTGFCDGEITITASGTPGPFSYQFGGPPNPFEDITVFDDQCVGAKTVFVKDSSNLIAPGHYYTCRIDLNLLEPTILSLLPPVTISPTCPDICNGQAFTFPDGGTGDKDVFWPISGETTTDPVMLCAGINPVQITDENGCMIEDTIIVSAPPVMVADPIIDGPVCAGDCNASILLNPTGGNGGPYSVLWSPVPPSGATVNPAEDLCAGSYDVTIFDTDGCTLDTTIEIIDPPVLTLSIDDIIDATCNGTCDGQATATPVGGVAPYTYNWIDNATGTPTGFTTQIVTTFCAGEYFVTVTDANGCVISSPPFTINEPPPFVINVDAYPVSCFGLCDGAADIDISGGTIPYTFSWTSVPSGVGVGATDSISGLCPGNYEIIVTDGNGCTSPPITVEVLEPTEISLTMSGSNPTCYDLCDGTAEVVSTGGTGIHTYSWSPLPITGDGTPNISNLCGEITYTVIVTDENGCTETDDIILVSPTEYDITTTVTDLDCFGDSDGAIDIIVNSGGSGAGYTYTWVPAPPVGDGTPNVSGLNGGTWSVTVADSEGCDTTLTFVITSPPELIVTTDVISNADCNGSCDGSAEVLISGGTPTYTVLWDDPAAQTTLVATGLCAGTFNVTVTDFNGCVSIEPLTITQPDEFDITTSQVDLDCFGDCDGTATVIVNGGGTPTYNIIWDDPLAQTTFTAIGLCAGTYNATVTDDHLCDTVLTFVFIEPTELLVPINLIDSTCFGECTGSAYVEPTGGTAPYTIQWFDAATDLAMPTTNDTINDLCVGDYYAVVTDANGCTTQSLDISIFELPEIIASIVSTTDATCAVCDGAAEITASGGDGSLTFDWDPDPTAGDGTTSVTGLCSGTYTVNIVDGSGCTQIITVSIDDIALEVIDLDSVDATCFGGCDGEVSVTFTELDGPYVIEWFDNTTGLTTGQFGNTATGLCAGDYLVVVTNASGCVTTGTISVGEPEEILATIVPTDVSCNGLCDGTASITVSGGNPPYAYDWGVPLPGAGEGTPNASGLCAGPWEVEVLDDGGCLVVFTTTVDEPTPIVIDATSSTDVSCFGDSDGSASVIVSGAVGPYTYEWFDCATGLAIGQTDPLATGLPPGDYQCVITDANGCTITSACIPVLDASEITAIINQENVSCYGECDGLMYVIPSGGVPTYFFQWLDEAGDPIPGQTNDSLENACANTFNIEITDINGCSQTFGPIDMTAPTSPWDVVLSQTNISCAGDCDGTATVTVLDGNTPPYTYLWDDPLAQTTPTANFLCEDTYTVTISDAGVCDTTITFEIIDNNPIFANLISLTNIDCFGDCDGQITIAPFGGVAPYTLNWSDGQTGTNPTGLCAGPITLSITDAAGCSIDTTITLTENPELTTTSTFSNNTTCGLCNGSATVNVSGGTPGYSYDWDPDPTAGEGTNNATGLCPGVISVTITDALGCTLIETFGISDLPSEDVAIISTDASCFGTCDGTATADYVCSDAPCTQEWFDAVTGTSLGVTTATITDLCPGDYFVEVINGSGCVTVESVTINSPPEIFANEIVNLSTCAGDDDASIVLAPTGGSGAGYTYSWSPVPPNGDGTNEALDIGPGLWEVTVTDGDGCSETFSFDITEPLPIEIVVDPTNPTCTGLCNGTILASVTGGAGGFTFQWYNDGVLMPGETSTLLGGLCPGNYNIEITDANGCLVTLPVDVTISEPTPITAPITSTNISCFGLCDGTASVTISGGVDPYVVNWFDATTGDLIGIAGPDATGLCAGSYFAIITDNNGCSFTSATIDIIEPTELTFTLTTTDNACFGFCTGTGDIVAAGGTPTYSYEWLDIAGDPIVGGTAPSVEDLCEGNYTVEVTDFNGCSSGLIPVIIDGFDEILGSIFSNEADCGVANGNASIFASGGSAPYTYQWFDVAMTPLAGEVNNTLVDVFSGIYFVTVTDANGCTETFMATISDTESPEVTFDAINHPTCFESCDGSIEITASGPNPPFVFSWNPGGLVEEDPTGLCAGDYLLEITDVLGCTAFYDTTLVAPSEIIVTPTITSTECGLCNGAIEIALSGGTGDYTVLWNTGETTTTISDLCSGVYEVVVTDENGCSKTEFFTVGNSSGLTIDPVVNAITCPGSCDGEISVTGVGGTAPYTFLWLFDGSTSNSLTGLCAGNYFVQVTDAIGCINTIEIELLEPTPIEAVPTVSNPSCGATDGSISLITSGGILPHTFLWSTGDPTSAISGLDAGIYSVTITDDNGCSVDLTFPLNNLTAPGIELTSTPVSCFGQCNGTIDTLAIIDGNPGFTFSWLDEAGTALGVTTPLITDLCAGDYILQITDAAGCISFESSTVETPDTILTNPLIVREPLCNGNCDGLIVSNPFGGTLPFSFSWDDPATQTTSIATGLCAGDYTVTITDANGCIVTQTETITEPTPLSIVIDSITPATCADSNDGEIYITASGGTGSYTYEWTNNVNADVNLTEDPIELLPYTYYLKLTDANGCEYFDTMYVDTLIHIEVNAGPDTSICNYSSLILTGSSNINLDENYIWMDTTGLVLSDSTQLVIPPSEEGDKYYVLQVEFMGCYGYDTIIISTYPPVFVEAGDDIDILPTQTETIGGDPTTDLENTVVWSPSLYLSDSTLTNPSVITPKISTWYTVEATDKNGCTNIDSVYVTVLPELEIPDGISPNGDGKNDTWILDFIDQYPGVSIKINVYNRWGELLYAADENYNDDWAGLTEEGKRLPAGTYYFVIDVDHEDFPDPFTGPLTIMW